MLVGRISVVVMVFPGGTVIVTAVCICSSGMRINGKRKYSDAGEGEKNT